LGTLVLPVLVGFAMIAGDAQPRAQAQPVALPSSVAVTSADPSAGTLRELPHPTSSHRKARRCNLRGHGGETSLPGLSFLVDAAGSVVPMHALTCLRRPAS
jgi:hypothetical protein